MCPKTIKSSIIDVCTQQPGEIAFDTIRYGIGELVQS